MNAARKTPYFTTAVAAGAFVLGVVATRLLDRSPETALAPTPPAAPASPMPIIAIDAGAIELLPDASLRLDRPRGFDFDGDPLPPGDD